jgi:hypothetical protein
MPGITWAWQYKNVVLYSLNSCWIYTCGTRVSGVEVGIALNLYFMSVLGKADLFFIVFLAPLECTASRLVFNESAKHFLILCMRCCQALMPQQLGLLPWQLFKYVLIFLVQWTVKLKSGFCSWQRKQLQIPLPEC